MTDLLLLGVFFGITLAHEWLENKCHALHIGWLAILAHPAVITTLKDWGIHILVYSKFALLGAH